MPPHVFENIAEMLIMSFSVLSFTGIVAWSVLRLRHSRQGAPNAGELAAVNERLARLEQAVEAVAVEVERSGEAQRFTARLLAERFGDAAAALRAPERVGVSPPLPRGAPHHTPH